MYLDFYGFKEKPFNLFADPEYLYLSSKHKAALAHLEYGLTDQNGFIVITGDVGTGKTTLLRHVVRHLDDRIQVAMVFNTRVTPVELVQMILREFDIYEYRKPKGQCYQILCDFFLDQFSRGNQCLVFIDEAQDLSPAGMEEIRMLSNLNEGNDTLVQVILAGQPSLQLKLERKEMRQFAQRVTTDFVLEPLEVEEIRNYVLHRMNVAGRNSGNDLFTPEAYERIYRFSQGIPRLINILCDGALVYGFADELATIDGTVIDEVVKDKKIKGQFFTEEPADQVHGTPPAAPALAKKLNIVSHRLDRLEAQFKAFRDNGNDHTIQELEKLLAAERERATRATHECGQRDMTIRMLKGRVDKLEKLRRSRDLEGRRQE